MPRSLSRVTMAGHGDLALSCSHLAPLADQEHGLLQAGGECGEGRVWILGGTGCRAPLMSPSQPVQIEYCRKAMARTRVKSSICLEG